MPITLPNWAQHETQDYNGYGNLLENALKGYEMARKPKQIGQEEQYRELANRLTSAKTRTEETFGGLGHLTGAAREVASYEIAKSLYGEDNPVTRQIKERMDADLDHTKLLNENYRNLNATAPQRHASSYGKKVLEGDRAQRGQSISPLISETPSPEQSQETANQYENLMFKDVTDPKLRQQLISGTNMEITATSIDPDKLFKYAGAAGGIQKIIDQGKILTGQESEDYAGFEEEMTKVDLWADQVRSFYGASVTKGVRDDLHNLTNPQYWSLNPKIAKRKFNSLNKILERELNTLRRAGKDSSIYKGREQEKKTLQGAQQQSPEQIDFDRRLALSDKLLADSNTPGGSKASVAFSIDDGEPLDIPLKDLPAFKLAHPNARQI